MAIGYGLANSIMIIGKTGVVIVDVTESYEAAAEIFEEFRKITDKPVTDIVYTHNHADHVHGAKVNKYKKKRKCDNFQSKEHLFKSTLTSLHPSKLFSYKSCIHVIIYQFSK